MARPEALTERKRVELLASAGAVIAESLEPSATLAAIAHRLTPALADLCIVYLVNDRGELERAEIHSGRPELAGLIARLRAMPPFTLGDAMALFGALASSREPVHVRHFPAELRDRLARSEEHRALIAQLDIGDLLIVPLFAGSRPLGAMALILLGTDREYSADDIVLGTEVGRLTSAAIDYARLRDRARDTARSREEARALTETLLAAAPVGFLQMDLELRITRVSDVTAELHGVPTDAHVGRTLPEVLGAPGETLERHFRAARDGAAPVQAEEVDVRLAGFGGEERNLLLNVYPIRDRRGALRGVAGVTMDVTDRVRSRRMLAFLSESSRRLAETLDLAGTLERLARLPLGVFADYAAVLLAASPVGMPEVTDAHVAGESAIPAAVRAGIVRSAERGRVAEVLRREEPALLNDLVAGAVRDPALADVATLLGARAMLIVPLEVRGATIGVMVYVRSTVHRPYDASEASLGEELGRRAAVAIDNARLYRETERANRAKADFLATMSHELRTPLNAIAGYAELLQMGMHGPVTDSQVEYLKRIQRNQRHLLGLINNILGFAKLEAGRVPFHVVTTRVAPVLASLEDVIAPQARQKGVEYVCEPCDPELQLRVDQEKMQQILINLLSNAVKFTERGGSVRLRCAAENGRVLIHVVDTGAGISADQLESIFEPFVQADSGLSRAAEGTGLGLAISRELARAMGGTITVESREGAGSTFTLSLPAREADAA